MWRRLVFLMIVLIAVALVAWAFLRSTDDSTLVETESVTRKASFQSFVTASGEIVATRYADIGSNIMGKIVSLPVVEGQTVESGQILARIDPVQARADLEAADAAVRALLADSDAAQKEVDVAASQKERAEAAFREAQLDLDRVKRLLKEGVAPRADLDRAQAAFETTQADVGAAAANLDRVEKSLAALERRVAQARAQKTSASDLFSKTEIRSPMSGVVSRLQVREGEMVVIGIQNQPGTTLMTISDLSGINAEVKVAEADILRVELGQSAQVTLDAVAGQTFAGKVIEIGTSALPSTGTGAAAREFRVVIRLDEPDDGMRPGLTCDAEILATELQDVITVPLQSVVIREIDGIEQTGVFLYKEGRAGFIPVSAGVIGGLDIAVEGLSEGAQVVTGPFQVIRELQDGDLLKTE